VTTIFAGVDPRRAKAPVALVLGLLACVGALLVTAPGAMANCATACTWTGESIGEPGSALKWSAPTDWAGGEVPVGGPNGTISFPALPSCGLGEPCYRPENDLTGLSANGIVIDDRSPYQLIGNAITLGSGGITTTAVGASTGSPFLGMPITLGTNQTWAIDGGTGEFPGRLVLESPVTGEGSTLGIDLSHFTILNLAGDNEVGAVTITGDGTGDSIGFADPASSSLNATDANPISVTDAGIYTFYGLSLGPLTFDEGTLQLGAETKTPKVSIAGPLDLGPTSASLIMGIGPATSPTPGADYSQLSATGDISLGNSSLLLSEGTSLGVCTPLPLGVVYTLVQSTGGTISGRFSNASEGSFLTPGCNPGESSAVRIDYHPASVTATVVSRTTTTLSSSVPTAVTNLPVTLTAQVAPASGSETPTGTVEFDDHGTAVPGCSGRPVDPSGTATCTTSFTASFLPRSLTAGYSPGVGFASSTSSPAVPFAVEEDSSATALSVSDTSPDAGRSVTFTATVTPGHAGPAQPSGSMRFLDGGTPIEGCSDRPLGAGASSSSATCTVSYASGEAHHVTASYEGDTNFTGSMSSAQTVTAKRLDLSQPRQPSVLPGPEACAEVRARAAPYTPTTHVEGRLVPGLRVRLSVGSPTELQVRARVIYRRAGKTHSADLGRYRLRVGAWRNLRLPLPKRLRSVIPRGRKATLLLGVDSNPEGSQKCVASTTTDQLRLSARVVNVLAG
jgi:Bacterial Ig-like domain (group 3)